jgi:hypothetical protein
LLLVLRWAARHLEADRDATARRGQHHHVGRASVLGQPAGNSILTIAYYLLSDPHARFADLGADFHGRFHPERRTRQLIRELEHLSGKKVTLHTAA